MTRYQALSQLSRAQDRIHEALDIISAVLDADWEGDPHPPNDAECEDLETMGAQLGDALERIPAA